MRSETRETVVHAAETARDTAARAARAAREHAPKDVLDRAGRMTAQARGAAAQVGHLAAEHTPPQLREQAGRAAGTARANRTWVLVTLAAAALTTAVLRGLRRGRR
ncbi:hypothetical protein GCM10018781_65840 [Kitasatospora indigofera]|uniref:DUF3618 domain-containing protein n=1 Tax=Kitasatospora indigofera TaxID=67307 RepID=A0A919GCC5_9ACTN|nr:hypothetical protein [Kitasatospora indigofera]GHH81983.1 hypothetical protein GCM10018781_65840 [Kitasatospora indigofera]